jgi:lysophospholipase L1-like esterase
LRWASHDKVADANRQIAAMTEPYLSFVDVYSHMLDEHGQPRKGLYKADGLHPSAECYRLWTQLIKPFLPPPGTN